MENNQKDLYFVAVKVFLEKDGKLFIFKDKFGDWDLPGGRLRKSEFEMPLEEVIKRKMSEEVGGNVQYSIGSPLVFFRHERNEANLNGGKIRIFAIGYEGNYIDSKIEMSKSHTQSEWVDIDTFEPEKYFTGGWLKGVEEYLEIKRT